MKVQLQFSALKTFQNYPHRFIAESFRASRQQKAFSSCFREYYLICFSKEETISAQAVSQQEESMANTGKKRTASGKSSKPTVRRKKKAASLEDIESSMEKMALTDFAESTKEELRKLGDKIHEATDKGVHFAKEIAEDVQKFAKDATSFTKVKIELHNLKSEKEKLYSLMGEHLSNLYKEKKLTKMATRFRDDFKKLNELESAIEEKEKEAKRISLSQ